jgi:hypothetical protein
MVRSSLGADSVKLHLLLHPLYFGSLGHAFFHKIPLVRFLVENLTVQATEVVADIGDLIALRIEVLNVVDDVVKLIN